VQRAEEPDRDVPPPPHRRIDDVIDRIVVGEAAANVRVETRAAALARLGLPTEGFFEVARQASSADFA
jgi:hypothetical protein